MPIKKSTVAVPVAAAIDLKAFADPQTIFENLEVQSTGTSQTDPYRARIEELMALVLRTMDADDANDAQIIRETSAGLALETAARETGFIIGFQYCCNLILSGAAKGGAR